jgi:hypothetical protein
MTHLARHTHAVVPPAPMPSFSRLPNYQRRALVGFLAQLR